MEQPLYYWDPVIAPSGMVFYTGKLFPAWQNSLFVGGLGSTNLVRLTLKGEQVVGEERLLQDLQPQSRTHPRRAPGPGWRDLPADRQCQGSHPQADAEAVALTPCRPVAAICDADDVRAARLSFRPLAGNPPAP